MYIIHFIAKSGKASDRMSDLLPLADYIDYINQTINKSFLFHIITVSVIPTGEKLVPL